MSSTNNKSLSFKNQNFFIGMDVHKKQWTISVVNSNMLVVRPKSIDPSPDVVLKFIQRLYPGGNYFAVYEAGFSGFWAARELNRLGIDCIVAHAADIPTSQKQRYGKNDRIDSKKLARQLSNGDLDAIYIPDELAEQYRYLNRYRMRFVKDQTRLKNRIKSDLYYFGIKIPLDLQGDRRWSGNFINWLLSIKFETDAAQFAFEDSIKQLVGIRIKITETISQLKKMTAEVKSFSTIVTLLRTIPGIGFITAITLLTEIITIDRFKNLAKLASYVGLIPCIQSSDETEINKGISKRRNNFLRSLIIEATWMAVKLDPALTMKFNKLCTRMKRNQAIVRMAKILLCRIRYVWKNQKPYVMAVVA